MEPTKEAEIRSDKIKFRGAMEYRLESLKQGELMHIPKEVLEYLLFDELPAKIREEEVKIRIPAWSGDFLSKIDLSEIEFDNVAWDNPEKETECFYHTYADEIIEEIGEEEYDRQINSFYDYKNKYKNAIIKYANTNARIDFKKSWEYRLTERIIITRCDFSGTDLSKSDMSAETDLQDSNFSNTSIKFNPNYRVDAFETNLEGADLSSFEVTPWYMDRSGLASCNLRNTGLKIVDFSRENIEKCFQFSKERLMQHLKNGDYVGCYINGKLMKTIEEYQEQARQSIQFPQFHDESLSDILRMIDEQNPSRKK